MKVLHVIPSIATADGGPARMVVQMVAALRAAGVDAQIATTDDAGSGARLEVTHAQVVEREGCPMYFFPRQTRFYKASLPMGRWLKERVREFDVVHVHALFSYAPWAAGAACRAARVPYVVRPLGVLNRYGMEQRRPWLKELSFRCIERPLLEGAAAIHYTSLQEADEAKRLNLRARPVILPLGIDLSPFTQMPDAQVFRARWAETKGRRLVLFLSRIDAKKGLDVLLPAFKQVREQRADAMMVIAGSGDLALETELRRMTMELGIEKDVLWTGFLDGTEKLSALAAADVFTLPSRSENFGIALLEAMAAGLPCVTTSGVALATDVGSTCLRLVALEARALADALIDVLDHPDVAARLGASARACAFQRYSADAAARELMNLYAELVSVKHPA